MGYSSSIMAETWESNLLYYAALSDDICPSRRVKLAYPGLDTADG